jgi:hypothetical protein
VGQRLQLRHKTFVTLFSKSGSNIVESVAILMAFTAQPHERWAGRLRRRCGNGDDRLERLARVEN